MIWSVTEERCQLLSLGRKIFGSFPQCSLSVPPTFPLSPFHFLPFYHFSCPSSFCPFHYPSLPHFTPPPSPILFAFPLSLTSLPLFLPSFSLSLSPSLHSPSFSHPFHYPSLPHFTPPPPPILFAFPLSLTSPSSPISLPPPSLPQS